jgi:hypothetical protein
MFIRGRFILMSGILGAGAMLGMGGGEHCRIAQAQEQARVSLAALDDEPIAEAPVVEIAICLDTSGSMDGLINAARQKLWSIVNDLALADPTPKLRVALLTYGNDGQNPENGWVQVFTPFTEDLDKVSEMLFALTTNGGTELVARVIQTSIEELEWTDSEDALKIIVVAGNESADQDTEVAFREACKAAIQRGVMVNPIYCRYEGDGPEVEPGWREIARLADGQYASIDQNNTTVVIATPYDDALIDLSTRLNETYIPFGAQGEVGWQNQQAQDANSLSLNKAAAAARAQTKGGELYACSWDLIDACRLDQVELADVKEEDLPENMKAMTPEEREQYVADMQSKREAIQQEIEEVNGARQRLMVAEQTRQAQRGLDQFDLIIRDAVRNQARGKGFEFEAIDLENVAAASELPYFVQWNDVWVASDLIGEYEDARAHHRNIPATVKITEGDEAYEAFAVQLGEDRRAALESIDGGVALVRLGEEVYEVQTLAPSTIEGQGTTASAQQMAAQVRQIAAPMPPQQAGQVLIVNPSQQGQTMQIAQQEEEYLSLIGLDPALRTEIEKHFVAIEGVWVDKRHADSFRAAGHDTMDGTNLALGYEVRGTFGLSEDETIVEGLDAEYAEAIGKAFGPGCVGVRVIIMVEDKPQMILDGRC